MNIKDLKYNKEEQEKFIKNGGLKQAAKHEKEILKKAFTKEETKEKDAKK